MDEAPTDGESTARVFVKFAPDDERMARANGAGGLPQWMVWSYSDESLRWGTALAWCHDEATADALLAALSGRSHTRCLRCGRDDCQGHDAPTSGRSSDG